MSRRVAKSVAVAAIAIACGAGAHYRSSAWLIASAIISEVALFSSAGKLIDAWGDLAESAAERRRRRVEKTERWHVRLERGFETTVYVPIGPHGSGEGAIELAKTLADAQGIYWRGGEFEPASGHGWGASHFLSRTEGGTVVSEMQERIVEWMANR